MDAPFSSLASLTAAVQKKRVSAVEVTASYLSRIAARDAQLGCFLRVDKDGALAQARAVDAQLAESPHSASLPLCGVPVGLKDVLCTRDLETTCGSKIL